jgi:hypothetical protein
MDQRELKSFLPQLTDNRLELFLERLGNRF